MSSLLIRSRDGVVDLTPQRARWRYVGFRVARLRAGDDLSFDTAEREACLVVLSGTCAVRAGDQRWTEVGERTSPFEGPPAAAYLPPRILTAVSARTARAEIALGFAPARRGAQPRLLSSPTLEVRGTGATERRIQHILMEDEEAESLLVTEVVTPGGHWSSYPPHKHDENDPPRETQLEEVYYHRLRDRRGFALQRVYTADRSLDESVTVHDGDVVLVPRGYHTVSAAPGYDLYYLNVMAGPVRKWCVTFDREHEWLRA